MNDADTDKIRSRAVMEGLAEMECGACRWLGSEDDACAGGDGRTEPLRYACPRCGSADIRDYVSLLSGYLRSDLL